MKFRMGIMTDFSIGRSLLTLNRVATGVENLKLEKVIVADDMTISCMIALQNLAKSKEFKAMVGVNFRCYENPTYRKEKGEDQKPNPYFSVKIFPKNEEGLRSIFRILSRANTAERYYYNPRGSVEDLKDLRDCVVTTSDFFGVSTMDQFNSIQLDDSCSLYVEIVPINNLLWDNLNKKKVEFYKTGRAKGLIASYPALYPTPEESDSLTPLRAVCTNTKITSEFLPHQAVRDLALENGRDMAKDIQDLQARINCDIDLSPAVEAKEFNEEPYYVFEKHAPCLPKMAEDEFETLVQKCLVGWKNRLFTKRLGYQPPKELLPVYKERLAYELSVLKKMGFANYFLVVEDLVNWSKQNGVRVGCGRGSGGGSLVAYLMGITEVDPIRFNLIFERFINPSRQDLPDIDLDYQSSKRGRVIEYLRERHGEDRVSGISNYGTLASASAFRDTGRVFGLTPLDMAATKLVPAENGISFSLSEAADAVPEIDKLKSDYPEIWKHALRFEGVMRSLGQHAAGTVVAGEPLVNRAVVERRSEGAVVNWDKRVVEDFGLIKMDILGLSTLDVLDLAQGYIKDRHGVDVDYLQLPLDDKAVLDAFGRGDTTAVFQFDSNGMQTLLKRLAKTSPLTFEDITAATALYRPGPLDSGLTEQFVAIKQGMKAPSYVHPNVKNALSETYGVMVYQEEVMQVARDLCGFTMAEADSLRKAIGKKNLEKMAEMKGKFVEGAVKHSGLEERKAEHLFEQIEKFAGYGFNKSHAVAYSILSYWTCYLKVHYPVEYFAAQLSIVREDKYPNIIRDAKESGVDVVPPDVNFSSDKFEIRNDHRIVMPFSAIKGCSEKIALKIVNARKKVGTFANMAHFQEIASQKGSGINKRVFENLNLVGAFAEIEPSQEPAMAQCRRKDQMVLMPGLIVDTVVSNKITEMGELTKLKIRSVVNEYIGCKNCNLCKSVHPLPAIGGANCQYMMVFDSPNNDEVKHGKMFCGKGASIVKTALKEAGVSASRGYFTSLVKAKKEGKFLTNEQINGCTPYLDKEVEVVNPGAIVCMGSESTRHFLPELKNSSMDIGNSYYNKDLDATIIVGFNPLQIFFDEGKVELLGKVVQTLAKVVNNK